VFALIETRTCLLGAAFDEEWREPAARICKQAINGAIAAACIPWSDMRCYVCSLFWLTRLLEEDDEEIDPNAI
jgi:hypothetical protein